jgi:hypothetical protein
MKHSPAFVAFMFVLAIACAVVLWWPILARFFQ